MNFGANALVTFAFSPLEVLKISLRFFKMFSWENFVPNMNCDDGAGIGGSRNSVLWVWGNSGGVFGVHLLHRTRDKGAYSGGN